MNKADRSVDAVFLQMPTPAGISRTSGLPEQVLLFGFVCLPLECNERRAEVTALRREQETALDSPLIKDSFCSWDD